MNKFYAIFTVFLLAISGVGKAQCNAQFTTQISGNTVQFVGIMPSNTGTNVWYFGDGTTSTQSNPVHTYSNCGVYTVGHLVEVVNPNGVLVCRDSAIQTINIICNTPCSAVASFTSNMVNNQPNVYVFTNTSTVSPATGPVVCSWNFGGGTTASSGALSNQAHTYASSGLFNVCLIVTSGQLGSTNICRDTFCMNVQVQVTNPQPCNVVATFTSTPTSSPNAIQFTNTSTNVSASDSVIWNFGDGTYGYGFNPAHVYSAAGTYNVCLRIVRNITGAPPCVSEICNTVTIQSVPCNIVPVFNFTQTASTGAPYVVTFTNQSIPANIQAAVTWTFGDGTNGTGYVATHTYAQAGTYTVCMTITSGTCVRDTCQTVVIAGTPAPCNLQASYTFTNNGNTYTFANTTTGYTQGDTIRWIFSNGTITNVQNPTVTFPGPGRYAVCLRVKKPTVPGAAPCVSEICDSVTVTSTPTPCNLQASFSATPVANQPNVFVFTNTSITANAPQVTWSFGDSTTGAGQVVTHTFNSPGTYTVCMFVAISNTCSADTCITVTVNGTNPNPCNLQANFSWQQTPASPNVIYFQNTSVGYSVGDSVRWTFGDGTSSLNNNPVHTYTAPGVYNICLRVKKLTPASSTPCVSEICRTITIAPPVSINCDSVVVSFNHYQDQMMPNKIRFISVSNYPVNQQSWTITDLSATSGTPVLLNQYNPVYVFPHTGDYRVCLRAVTAGNCIKEYCDTINISSVATQCMLMAYPNPAHNQVSVNAVLSAPTTLYAFVFNAQNVLVNQRIVSGNSGSNVITFNTSNLVAGYYTIRLYYNGQFCVARFQKL